MKSITIIFAIIPYTLLMYGSIKEAKFEASSFILWLIIDGVMLTNTIRAHHNYDLIGTFTIMTFLFVALLLVKQKIKWSTTDTKVAILAFILVLVSMQTKAFIGVIAGGVAIFMAGIPNMKKELGRTSVPPIWLICGAVSFFMAPLFNAINLALNNKPIEEFTYSILAQIYWVTIIIKYVKIKFLQKTI